MITNDILRKAGQMLAKAGLPDPQRDARIIWRATPDGDIAAFDAKIAQRMEHVPMSHILGYRDFYKHRFFVTRDVLDPRPDTETLVETALQRPFSRLLDLGTGSGCILLSLLDVQGDATGIGTDLSDAAIDVAQKNCAALGLGGRAEFMLSDWFGDVGGKFDLIVSNPPYIGADEMDALQPEVRLHEPRMALTDEGDGLAAYRIITKGAPEYLLPGGRLIMEIGPTQAQAVTKLMRAAGFGDVAVVQDMDGRDRVVCGFLEQ